MNRFTAAVLILLVSSVFILFTGCDTTSPPAAIPSPVVNVSLLYTDEAGNDLLNPDRPVAWNVHNIEIYHLKNGEKEKRFDGNLDRPKGIFIHYNETEERYKLGIRLSEHISDGFTVTYVEFPNGQMDTLRIRAEKKSNGVMRASKFWYNNVLLFDENEYDYQDLGLYEILKSSG